MLREPTSVLIAISVQIFETVHNPRFVALSHQTFPLQKTLQMLFLEFAQVNAQCRNTYKQPKSKISIMLQQCDCN